MKICLSCESLTPSDTATDCSHCGDPLADTLYVHSPARRGDDDGIHPLVGKVVGGKYRVTGVLGRGGMGVVLRAVHAVSHVPVALKVLHPRYASRSAFRSWFLEEAQKAGRVVHENTARVLDVGAVPDGPAYIAIELVDGQTLDEWVQSREGVLPPAAVVEILLQIARALAAAHAVGVVHRDLTPRNVMVVARDGRLHIKVLDFGIARANASGSLATTGGDPASVVDGAREPARFATPPYAAPEILSGEGEADERADLYGLGVLAFELLNGVDPARILGVEGRDEVAQATVEGGIASQKSRQGLPRELVRLVNRLLARDPGARPASAISVAQALSRLSERSFAVRRWAAVAAFLVAAFVFWDEFRPRREVYVGSVPDSPLVVYTDASSVPSEPTVLTPAALRAATLSFGGFPLGELRIEARVGVRLLSSTAIEPGVTEAEGRFLLASADEMFLDVLQQAGDRGQTVELFFVRPGSAPLAQAHVLVDRVEPRVDFSTSRSAEDVGLVLGGDLSISWRCTDNDAVAVTRIVVSDLETEQHLVSAPVPSATGGALCLEELADSLGGVVGLEPTRADVARSPRSRREHHTDPQSPVAYGPRCRCADDRPVGGHDLGWRWDEARAFRASRCTAAARARRG